ncbi:MAG: LptA/OstA family protein [Erythrobacter sp.]
MQNQTRVLLKSGLKSGLAAFALTAVGLGGLQWHISAQAQAIAGHNSRAPVDFDAGRIELQDRQNRVVLSGNVIVRQAGLRVNSQRMLLNYSDAGSLQLNRITATGGVTVTRGNESATGDAAIYDFNRRIITLAGNVRLRRGSDTLSGGRLVIDLQTGVSSIDGRSSGGSAPSEAQVPGVEGAEVQPSNGRVRGTFSVPQ